MYAFEVNLMRLKPEIINSKPLNNNFKIEGLNS